MMVVGLKSPARASSLTCATSCQVRAKMRSFSCSRTAASRYIEAGRVYARATPSSIFIGTIQSRTDLAFIKDARDHPVQFGRFGRGTDEWLLRLPRRSRRSE